MRRLVELGLALLAVAAGAVHAEVRADPAAPQLSPGPGRREDAQRLQEQLRDLEPAAPLPPLPPAEPPPVVEPPSNVLGIAGVVLLCVAGGTGASVVALSADDGSDDGVRTALLVTAAVSAAAGLTLVLTHRKVQAVPAVAPHAVGVAIAGHL